MEIPDTNKKIAQRISSYKSKMNREKRDHGHINDDAGKRYVLFALHFLLDDIKKSQSYFDWYESEFSDDIGEPVQKLCWALSLHKMGQDEKAKHKLADLMLSNLYFIPKLLGRDIKEYGIRHTTNYEEAEYFFDTPPQVLNNITDEDKGWMKNHYDSFEFRRIRKRYIEIFTELSNEEDRGKRRKLLDESYGLLKTLH